jgi:hypothetical protein
MPRRKHGCEPSFLSATTMESRRADASRLLLQRDIAIADARVREADAAVITARAVPNPTLHLGPQFREASIPNFAPWASDHSTSICRSRPPKNAATGLLKPNDWPMLRGSRLAKRQEEEKLGGRGESTGADLLAACATRVEKQDSMRMEASRHAHPEV